MSYKIRWMLVVVVIDVILCLITPQGCCVNKLIVTKIILGRGEMCSNDFVRVASAGMVRFLCTGTDRTNYTNSGMGA